MNTPSGIRKDKNTTASALFGVAILLMIWGAITWFVYNAELNRLVTALCFSGIIYIVLGIAALWIRLPAAFFGLILYAAFLAYEICLSLGHGVDLVMTDYFFKIPIIILLLIAVISPLRCSMPYKVVITTLAIALVVSLGFFAHALWLSSEWKAVVSLDAVSESSEQARQDIQKGRYRLFEFQGENEEDKFSGRYQGKFEIWYAEYHPSVYALRFSEEKWVQTYNEFMMEWSSWPTNSTAAKLKQ